MKHFERFINLKAASNIGSNNTIPRYSFFFSKLLSQEQHDLGTTAAMDKKKVYAYNRSKGVIAKTTKRVIGLIDKIKVKLLLRTHRQEEGRGLYK